MSFQTFSLGHHSQLLQMLSNIFKSTYDKLDTVLNAINNKKYYINALIPSLCQAFGLLDKHQQIFSPRVTSSCSSANQEAVISEENVVKQYVLELAPPLYRGTKRSRRQ